MMGHPDRFNSTRSSPPAARYRPRGGAFILSVLAVGLFVPNPGAAQERGSPELDSLRAELGRLSREYAEEVQRIMGERRAEMEDYRAELEALQEELTEGRRALADETREAMQALREALGAHPTPDRRLRAMPPGAVRTLPSFRAAPGPPLLFGQRVVAGAEVVALNPSLGGYFGVESGILVVEVAERSPAADAGLQPGDVVLEVNGEPVDTVEDLRRELSRHTVVFFGRGRASLARPSDDDEVTLRIFREGEPMDLTLPS